MSRFLFVVPPLVGHVNPTLGVAARLAEQGHQVAWAGHAEFVTRLAGPEAAVLPCALPHADGAAVERPADLRGPAALKFLWETFLIPLAEAMIPGVYAAVDEFKPDVLVVDQQAVAGAVVAQRTGIPWATSATTAAELADPLGGMPKVAAWVREMLLHLELRYGDPTAAASDRYQCTYGDLRFSPHLVLAYSSAELSGCHDELGDTLRYVGPSIAVRPHDPGFPWHALPEEAPLVLVTIGTANSDTGGEFLNACAAALADRPELFGIFADPAEVVTQPPDNVLTAHHVPQLELLPWISAVICHAGQNTVCEALYHRVPLVVAPIRDDQPIVAQQAAEAGAAIRVRFGRARADHVGAALDTVLTYPQFRQAAARVAESFRAAGGAAAAAEHLVRLAAHGKP
ncbi:MAG TPA: nucleotide disphospho-sugar-binding domain-containing protein [Actinocrinis sp.]|uniref:glycosyltransferase n=1 Tax=Actinocrinis sp. TaxID=1920516 RepID=UPI002DDD45FE|nr:nucleotide disphospho-sugar-binding domain-containing protein [Actinocrinis sp.]HEV3169347.1 nucleotide disphospho-sugar-binding domain-containing protein [Actinocrinis sp.]